MYRYDSDRAKRILLSVFLFLLVVSGLCFPVHADDETVRVGYYENEVFEEGASEGAIKKGYAY